MTEDQIKHMVDRFLAWNLPRDFNPDGGISYTRPGYHPDVDDRAILSGTNLFDGRQATAMVRYMVEGLPSETPSQPPQAGVVPVAYKCLGKPGECNWPDCGCDPHAMKVIESLVEQGWTAPELGSAQELSILGI